MQRFYIQTLIGFLLTSSFMAAHAQTISTVAGTGAFGYNGDNIAATVAQLNKPAGVTIDNAGNIIIGDFLNNRVRKISTSGFITTIAGNGFAGYNGDNIAATAASLFSPQTTAYDQSGNLYFNDGNNNRIRKVNTSGLISTVAGTGYAGYNGDNRAATTAYINFPTDGILVDAVGNMFFADTYNHRVRKVIKESGIIITVAGTGTGEYNGDNISATSASLFYPYGIALDASGNLYIADGANNRVRKVNTNGIITTVAGTGGSGYNGDNRVATSATLNYPEGVAVDGAGNIYIADYNNSRVRRVEVSTGLITTIVGTGAAGYNGDNIPANTAQINHPIGLNFDVSGNLYIADFDNSRVRKVVNVGVPLPLTLTKFSAQLQNGIGYLQWQTSNEVNTKYFGVESSRDAVSFTEIGQVQAKSTSGNHQYSFLDANLQTGATYYRLKMMDKDGRFTYSSVAAINVKASTLLLTVSPNPVHNLVYLSFYSSGFKRYTVQTADMMGKIVSLKTGQTAIGNNKVLINMSSLASGTYFLTVTNGDNSKATMKLIKK
jgi:sugar lactone lactonase YvrE